MKKILLSLLLLPALAFAQSKGFVLTGSVAGLAEGAEVKLMTTQNSNVVAQGTIKGGSFTLKGEVQEPTLFWIVLGKEQPQYIYVENGTMKISGSQKDIKNLKIEGSKSQKDFEVFSNVFNPLVGELNGTAAQIQKATNEKKREELVRRYDSVNKVISSQIDSYIAARKSSYVSPFVLFVTAQLSEDIALIERRYQMLDSAVRTSGIGKSLAEYIAYNKVGSIGSDAMEFVQNDVSGNPVSLSSFKGKYVLIDFWASWCKPCRLENPNVVKAYEQFKNKNFTVLGVSLDQEKDPWVKAIEKDKLNWTQVSDLQFWNNAAAQLYRVQSIPQNFLIGPDGKILAKDLRGADLTTKLCELLGCN